MGLKLNLSEQEAQSVARTYELPPTGEYICNIVELEEGTVSPTAKNAGKPKWKGRFVIDEGQFAGTTLFAHINLFQDSLYQAVQLTEAVFPHLVDRENKSIDIPDGDAFIGKQVKVVGVKYKAGSKIYRGKQAIGTRDKDAFEVKGFKAVDAPARSAAGQESLLP